MQLANVHGEDVFMFDDVILLHDVMGQYWYDLKAGLIN